MKTLIITDHDATASHLAMYLAEQHGPGKADTLIKAAGPVTSVEDTVIVATGGHLYVDPTPEHYDPKYKVWRKEDLPIVPEKFVRIPSTFARHKDALAALERHIPSAERIIHACDPERDGQLIGDEILADFDVKVPVERLHIRGFDPASLDEAFRDMRPNGELRHLAAAARSRSRADWLWGTNLSRKYTIAAREEGHKGTVSVGRVVSPAQYLIHQRECARATHSPVTSYRVQALLAHQVPLLAQWRPTGTKGTDLQGNFVDERLANEAAARLRGVTLVVSSVNETVELQPPGAPYTLSTLQTAANHASGYTADIVARTATALFRRGLVSFPRSGKAHYRQSDVGRAGAITATIAANLPEFAPFVAAADLSSPSVAFVDTRERLHAMMPLPTRCPIDQLTTEEQDIYAMIARRYLAQFYPPASFRRIDITLRSGVDELGAALMIPTDPGHLVVDPPVGGVAEPPPFEIPTPRIAEPIGIKQTRVVAATSSPLPHFTDGTLIEALNHVVDHVQSEELKRRIGPGAKIGTESTQANLIETLIKNRLIERSEMSLTTTKLGADVAEALPLDLKGPALTAKWDRQLDAIAAGTLDPDAFLAEQVATLRRIISEPVMISFTKSKNWKPGGDVERSRKLEAASGRVAI